MTKSAQKWKNEIVIRDDELCYSLTTVSKDNLVLEYDED